MSQGMQVPLEAGKSKDSPLESLKGAALMTLLFALCIVYWVSHGKMS